MKHRGITGIGIIVIIVIVLLFGYIVFMIGRLEFNYAAIRGKALTSAELGASQGDEYSIKDIIETAQDQKVRLAPDQIFIDHNIKDSVRIFFEYDDSSNIFGIYTYRKHFKVDVVKAVKFPNQ